MKKKELPKIEIGFRIGSLIVEERTADRKNGYSIWVCRCTCGGTILLDTRTLQRGTVRDCGCISRVKPGQKDITGQKFGRLTALEPTQLRSSKGSTIWKCRCDCGGEVYAPMTQLTSGYRKSCGCLSHPPLKDYIGKRFGRLIVTEYAGKVAGMHRWRCLCDCGKTTVVGQTLLQSGKTKSCGCIQASIIVDTMKFIDGTSVTALENTGDRLLRSNTSGYNGVHWDRRRQRWVAQIGFKGKRYSLGSYKKIDDAVRARKNAEERIYGEFLEWYYETYKSQHKNGFY